MSTFFCDLINFGARCNISKPLKGLLVVWRFDQVDGGLIGYVGGMNRRQGIEVLCFFFGVEGSLKWLCKARFWYTFFRNAPMRHDFSI